ncbi:hypothetical protein TKK_0002322 [Trichogramma kaykai]|uniref:Fatty acyl-CoA reductase n=1 Tax=Trichogramma kaykai TaxID=54128 RepID=A0ABD2XB28_9HYME
MSLRDWYSDREILLVGVTSQLGRNLLEKLLRSFRNVRVHVVLRSKNDLGPHERVKNIFESHGYQRLRQTNPKALSQVSIYNGDLGSDNMDLKPQDHLVMKNVSVAIHAAGPTSAFFDYCRGLANLKAVITAKNLYSYNDDIILENSMNERLPKDLPIGVVRFSELGPAYREPMPGFVEAFQGPTALIVGAGYMFGSRKMPVEIIPVDIATNTLIAVAWDIGTSVRGSEPQYYNASTVGGTWDDLIKKSRRADSKFPYPNFRVRGMSSLVIWHFIVVLLFEWLPSAICDTCLFLTGKKTKFLAEHSRVRGILDDFEKTFSRMLLVQREKIESLQKNLTLEDQELIPMCSPIDVEAYVLCTAASVRKLWVDESNLKIISLFQSILLGLIVSPLVYYYFVSFERS